MNRKDIFKQARSSDKFSRLTKLKIYEYDLVLLYFALIHIAYLKKRMPAPTSKPSMVHSKVSGWRRSVLRKL